MATDPMFYVKSGDKELERHPGFRAAERAFWLLTAHELKNGRIADLTLTGKSACAPSVCFPDECVPALPEWAMEILKAHDLWRP